MASNSARHVHRPRNNRVAGTRLSLPPRLWVEQLEGRMLLSGSIPLSTSVWTPIGPASIGGGTLDSGRLAGVAADPSNANVLYIAAAGGGVWKTVDGGSSWTPLTDNQSTLFMGAISVAPSNPSVIYAGTGEATNSGLSFYGRGVLKSIDAGATWTLLGNSNFDRHTIARIAIDPTNPDNVYVAIADGGVNGVGGNSGIFHSTNGGTTWTNTTTAISTNDQFDDIEIDPSNPARLFCADTSGSDAGIYQSINAGGSWTKLTNGLPGGSSVGDPRVAIAPSNPQIVYASFDNPSTNGALGIWKSIDGGVSWSQPGTVPNYMGGQGWYDTSLGVDPSNPSIAYAGGQGSFIQTTDGGTQWNNISNGANGGGPHSDHHAIAFDANGHLLDGNDGGIWRLDNPTPGAIAWTDLNSNLQITQFIGGALSPTDPNVAFGGSQDNGTEQFTGSPVWTMREGGDGGRVQIDQQNPSIVYHQAPTESFGKSNFFRRSTDGGVTWTAAVNGISTADAQNFYAPFVVDPNNGDHLLYGTSRVYETTNQGTNWSPISTPNTNGWTSTASIDDLALAASSPGTIYASAGGHIFVTTNDGAAWTQRDPAGTGGAYAQIAVDPSNPQTAYVVRSAFGGPHLLRTTDGGATWQDLSGDLPNLPTWSIALNPAAGAIYIGNDNGVWVSTTDGTSWSSYAGGMPNVQVRDLEFSPSLNILAAATHGRGMWELSTAPAAPLLVNTLADETTAGDGLLSLREAVAMANSNGDAIGFDPSLAGGTINLSSANGPLSITGTFSIIGPAGAALTISSAAGSPIEVAAGASPTLGNLSLAGPQTVLQIDSGGTAALQDAVITGNVIDNGALIVYQFANGADSGSISGSGSLLKSGPESLTLTGNNSYTGGTTINGGTLAGNTNALMGTFAVTAGTTLAFDQSSLTGTTTGTFTGSISGAGTMHVLAPASMVQLAVGALLNNSGPTVIDPGAALLASATGQLSTTSNYIVDGTLDLKGFDQRIGALAGSSSGTVYSLTAGAVLTTLTVGGGNINSVYSGLLEDAPPGSGGGGALALQKIGTGTLTLAGGSGNANTESGGMTVVSGTLSGNSRSLTGSITDNAALIFDQSLGGVSDGSFSGAIWGSGTLAIANGTLRLAPGSTLRNSGPTAVNGTLIGPASGAAGAFSSGSAYTVNGVLDLGAFDQTIGSLVGTGTVYHSQVSAEPALATLTTGGSSSSTLFGGILEDAAPGSGNSGVLAIQKTGSGTLTLTGANTYSGGTILSAGTVAIGPSASDPLGSGTINLSGGTLSLQGRVSNPVQQIVPTSGYNQDVIVEASAANPLAATSIAFDGTRGGGNNVWYEKGFGGTSANGTGLPVSGSIFASAANPSVSFQLQPYNANNVAMINGGNGSITLQLSSPASFASLNILATAANGAASLTATLNFTDGTTAVDQLGVSDWFNGNNAAIVAGGRIARTAAATVSLTSGNPRLYEYDFALAPADQAKVLDSITFKEFSGNQVGIYALSGAVVTFPPAQSYPNAVLVSADSVIDIRNSPQASLGSLAIGSQQLSLTGSIGASLTLGPVILSGNAAFNPASGLTLTLGPISGPGQTITEAGPGTLALTAANAYAGTVVDAGTLTALVSGSIALDSSLTIGAAGVVKLLPAAPPFTATLDLLSIAAGGKLDLSADSLDVAYGPGADPAAMIRSDLASGTILSSLADATRAIGYGDAADNMVQGLPANNLLLRLTIPGDANLDGTVNLADFLSLTRDFGNAASNWDQGDFNYDGAVNLADLLILVRHFGQSYSPPPSGGAPSLEVLPLASDDPSKLARRRLVPEVQTRPA